MGIAKHIREHIVLGFSGANVPAASGAAAADTAAIQSAITAAGVGGTVNFAAGGTYVIHAGLVPLTGQIWNLNGATIKRCDEVIGTAASDPDGDTTVTLTADAAGLGFVVGMDIVVYDSSGPYFTWEERRITNIAGTVITVNAVLEGRAESGATHAFTGGTVKVISGCNMIRTGTYYDDATPSDYFVLRGGTIDGNKDNNTTFHRWQIHNNATLVGAYQKFIDVAFINAHGDGLVLCGRHQEVRNCRFQDCIGNGLHIGDSAASTSYRGTHHCAIRDNRFIDCNLGLAYHDNGAIAFSSSLVETFIENNYFLRCQSAVGGVGGPDDGNWYFRNNAVIDMYTDNGNTAYAIQTDSYGLGDTNEIDIDGNLFIACLPVRIYGNNTTIGIKRVNIKNNTFVNTMVQVQLTENVDIDNNRWYMLGSQVSGITSAAIFLKQANEVRIRGNTIEQGGVGIQLDPNSGTPDKIVIQNNQIKNTRSWCIYDQTTASRTLLEIGGNTIIIPNAGGTHIYNGDFKDIDVGWHMDGDVSFGIDNTVTATSINAASYALCGTSGVKTLTQFRCLRTSYNHAVSFNIENYTGSGSITLTMGGDVVASWTANAVVSATYAAGSSNSDFVLTVPDGCGCRFRNVVVTTTAANWRNSAVGGILCGANGSVRNNNILIEHNVAMDGIQVTSDNTVVFGNVVRVPATPESIRFISGADNNFAHYNYVNSAIVDSGTGNTIADTITVV